MNWWEAAKAVYGFALVGVAIAAIIIAVVFLPQLIRVGRDLAEAVRQWAASMDRHTANAEAQERIATKVDEIHDMVSRLSGPR